MTLLVCDTEWARGGVTLLVCDTVLVCDTEWAVCI